MHWKIAEESVKSKLEKEFGQDFIKKKLPIGQKSWEFDLVSEDGKVVAQVKSCQKKYGQLTDTQIQTRFKRGYAFDCLLLDRVKADRKYFFLVADKELFDHFKDWSKGLFSPDIRLEFIED